MGWRAKGQPAAPSFHPSSTIKHTILFNSPVCWCCLHNDPHICLFFTVPQVPELYHLLSPSHNSFLQLSGVPVFLVPPRPLQTPLSNYVVQISTSLMSLLNSEASQSSPLFTKAHSQLCLKGLWFSPTSHPRPLSKPSTPATLFYALHNSWVQILTLTLWQVRFPRPGMSSLPFCLAESYPLGNKFVGWWIVFVQVQNRKVHPCFLWPLELRPRNGLKRTLIT